MNKITYKKCPTCVGGPDNICSDGKCYVNGVGCPIGTVPVGTGACTCSYKCSASSKFCSKGQCTSSLQVTPRKKTFHLDENLST